MTTDTQEPAQQSIGQIIQEAIALQRAGQLDAAEQRYRTALVIEPNNADALHNLGVLLCKQRGQVALALPLFKSALQAYPNGGQYWLSYAETLLDYGQPDEARLVLDEVQRRGLSGDAVHAL